ncbi:MAG: hypothetical protein H0T76_06120 [Nannocystis sp.]|nr:hypothetical protein [Nannocystis sp.]MBA3546037.1 hypothetical protein [Nannocystis sp.]
MTSGHAIARGPVTSLSRDADYPCAMLCMVCGRLGDPAPDRPYRTDPGNRTPEPCAHCGQTALTDLAPATTALALADALERDRPERSPLAHRLALRLVTVTAAALSIGGFTLFILMLTTFGSGRGWQVASALAGVMIVLFGGPGTLLLGRAIRRTWRRTTPRRLPARWRYCLPVAGAPGRTVEGRVACEGALLTAPISGRRCVAFEVGLREDDDADAHPGTWLLLEQRCVAFRIGDMDLAADGACFMLAHRSIAWPQPGPDRDRAALFLRTRGFVVSEATMFRVFEVVVAVGDLVAVLDTTPPTVRASAPARA